MQVPLRAGGSLDEPTRLLAHLAAWPFLRIEQRGANAALYFSPRHQAIGTVDVRTGTLTVDVGRDAVGPLLERHPQLQVTGGGVRLDVTEAEAAPAAEALIRWRVDLERFAPQLRDASP